MLTTFILTDRPNIFYSLKKNFINSLKTKRKKLRYKVKQYLIRYIWSDQYNLPSSDIHNSNIMLIVNSIYIMKIVDTKILELDSLTGYPIIRRHDVRMYVFKPI